VPNTGIFKLSNVNKKGIDQILKNSWINLANEGVGNMGEKMTVLTMI
jgi:hypothetical protein